MLITPAVLGVIAGTVDWVRTGGPAFDALALVAIVIAWLFGYGAFFAFGLAAKARTPERRAQYTAPIKVYGAVCAAALLIVLLVRPQTMWWALPYLPLIGVALAETLRGRSRSMLSGVSTTVASALLVPVLADVGGADLDWSSAPVIAFNFLAIYFSGTIPFVKTMIRERGDREFLRLSVAIHVGSIVLMGFVLWAAQVSALPAAAMLMVLIIALVRAVWFPFSVVHGGKKWTAKQIGMAEVFVLLLAAAAVLVALV